MRNILDIGQQGAAEADVQAPAVTSAAGLDPLLDILGRFPAVTIEAEVDDGTKKSVEVHRLPLDNSQVFGLVWSVALYEPTVYARQGSRAVMGMLSPNFDAGGVERQSSIKVLPLATAYPLNSRLLPDARMATMLAGSAQAEGAGSGGHDKPVDQDFEHKLTIIGAISKDANSITENGSHVQHQERTASSVATGLTTGKLGNMFRPDGAQTGDFTGYGQPMIFRPGSTNDQDVIFVPKSFLEARDQAFGVYFGDACRIMYGAALQIMYTRQGKTTLSDQISRIAEAS